MPNITTNHAITYTNNREVKISRNNSEICITFISPGQPSQEKLKTMLMQTFGGANKVHFGRCASSESLLLTCTMPKFCQRRLI